MKDIKGYIEKKFNFNEFIFNDDTNIEGVKNYFYNAKADAIYCYNTISKYLTRDKKILEVGGGIHLLTNFLDENYQITSVEPGGFIGLTDELRNQILKDKLMEIVKETLDFDFPIIEIADNIAALELFQGPTLAFKDVGARFMARSLGHLNQGSKEKITVLVATSGDTGGAVANGFLGVKGVNVVILYPKGKVSEIQEKQLTTLGQNITALEIDGVFDDCQEMVKTAFLDSA